MAIQASEQVERLVQRLATEHLIGREPNTLDRVRILLADEFSQELKGRRPELVEKIVKVPSAPLPPAPPEPEIVEDKAQTWTRPLDRPETHKEFTQQTADLIAQRKGLTGLQGAPETDPGRAGEDEMETLDAGDGNHENVTLVLGDLVQWKIDGVLQLPATKRITGFSEDLDFAFLDHNPTGVPLGELVKVSEDLAAKDVPAHPSFLSEDIVLADPTASDGSGESLIASGNAGNAAPEPSEADPSSAEPQEQPSGEEASSSSSDSQPETADDPESIPAPQDSAGSSPSDTTEEPSADPLPASEEPPTQQPSPTGSTGPETTEANDAA